VIERMRSLPSLLLVAIVWLVLLTGQSLAQFGPAPPAAPHPDSSTTVVVVTAASMMVAAMVLDGTARTRLAAERSGEVHGLSHVGNHLGRGPMLALVMGGVYGGAKLANLDAVSTPSGRILAGLVAAGTVNGLMKFTVGRARPRLQVGRTEFQPFSLDDRWQSFPSGHALTAFALAAAISEQADRGWVTGAAFGTATLVGWSRIHEDRHWTSDVVAGAIIGSLVSRYTVRHLEARSAIDDERIQSAGRAALATARIYPLPYGVAVSIPTH
jgi:membrane-associated phospholipid phosphatase